MIYFIGVDHFKKHDVSYTTDLQDINQTANNLMRLVKYCPTESSLQAWEVSFFKRSYYSTENSDAETKGRKERIEHVIHFNVKILLAKLFVSQSSAF